MMTRERFEKQLMIADDVWAIKELSASARELAKHDASQRALIEQQAKELELKEEHP